MSAHRFVGSRIREKRLDQGLRQAEVAEAVGISASYLNLIEHNKRRIAGKLLSALAQVLGVEPGVLASGADATLVDGMRSAAARAAAPVEVERAEDVATRYPGWAQLIAAQDARISVLEDQVQALTDRIGNDPALAGALHNMITSITAISATAGILVSDDKVDADWQRRFHINLRDDSQRLAEESKSLVTYLDQPGSRVAKGMPVSGFDMAEAFIAAQDGLLRTLDRDPETPLADLLSTDAGHRLTPDGRMIAERQLKRYAQDAIALPYTAFCKAALACKGDPSSLADIFKVDLPTVFRRLAYLPDGIGLPPMGLAVCDGAGVLTTLKPLSGFGLNRRSPSCPLWPLFTALQQPGRPVRSHVALPDPVETRFVCYAVAEAQAARDFDAPAVLESTMLVMTDDATDDVLRLSVGTSCRICPRSGCKARREPSIVAVTQDRIRTTSPHVSDSLTD